MGDGGKMRLNGGQIVCESLIREGVDVFFGYPGGVVLPLYDVFPQYPELRHVLVRHEQAAAHAADGYARATKKVGVCLATSGPGATNLTTGIATAMMDSVPMVAITGNVTTTLLGKDAFQETDITGITLGITKHSYLVTRVEELAEVIHEAFYIACTGRPGPVHIDITKDVFQTSCEVKWPDKIDLPGYKPTYAGHASQIKKAAKMINEAKRPVLLVGHGVVISEAYDELRALAERAQIPVITTYLGLGSFPETHVLSYGMVGMHGNAYANWAIAETDVLIGVGMRFDDRVTGATAGFAPKAKVIHIDIDPAEIGKNIPTALPIVGDCKAVLASMIDYIEPTVHTEWLRQIDEWRETHPTLGHQENGKLVMQYVLRSLYEATGGEAIVTTGVGQHQMWAAQHIWWNKPDLLITSGGLGTMGFGLPSAVGAKLGRPDKEVWCIEGDGGFQMTMYELATCVQEHVNIKIAVMNNGNLGMVRQWQEFFYERRYVHSYLNGPDYPLLAQAYGIPGRRIEKREDVVEAIEWARSIDGPVLMEFVVDEEENVYPMVAPGASADQMIHHPDLPKVRVR
jgi:acetolactate synthase-1/2/3 large subunit